MLIETALVLPLVLMLIFGMITAGMALGQKNAMENSAREASRFGSTLEITSSTNDWLDDVAETAIGAATGDLDPGTPGRYVCVALIGTSDGNDGRKIIEGDIAKPHDTGSCGPTMSCPANPCVQVALRREATVDLVATAQLLTLEASAVSTFERK